jgi:hypothetical protein
MFKQMVLGLGLLLVIFGLAWNRPASAARQIGETAEPTVEPLETPATEPAVEITDEPTQEPAPTQAPGTVEPLPDGAEEPTAEPVTPEPTGEAAPPEPTEEPIPPMEPTVEPGPPAESTAAPLVEVGGVVSRILAEGRPADRQNGHQLTALDSAGIPLTGLTAADGSLTLADVPAGQYRLLAQSPGFLAAGCDMVIEGGVLASLSEATLLAGDLDSSGEVDLIDAVTIGTVFGSTQPGGLADLNLDGVVDILDFVLLAANFGQSAAANPWLCQP